MHKVAFSLSYCFQTCLNSLACYSMCFFVHRSFKTQTENLQNKSELETSKSEKLAKIPFWCQKLISAQPKLIWLPTKTHMSIVRQEPKISKSERKTRMRISKTHPIRYPDSYESIATHFGVLSEISKKFQICQEVNFQLDSRVCQKRVYYVRNNTYLESIHFLQVVSCV